MTERHYNVNVNVTFSQPLIIRFESDAAEIQKQTELLHGATGSLEEAVKKNTPPEQANK